MTGELTINGKDAFTTWGIFLTDEAISAILTPPPLKEPITNSSRLQNGEQLVTSSLKVDARDLTITLNLSASNKEDFFTKYLSFCEELKKGILVFKISYQPSVAYTFLYRNCQQFSQYRLGAAKFLLRLSELNPVNRSV